MVCLRYVRVGFLWRSRVMKEREVGNPALKTRSEPAVLRAFTWYI